MRKSSPGVGRVHSVLPDKSMPDDHQILFVALRLDLDIAFNKDKPGLSPRLGDGGGDIRMIRTRKAGKLKLRCITLNPFPRYRPRCVVVAFRLHQCIQRMLGAF
ncbi:hypothetical protein MAR_036384 [Mya arenaria]|uniref:Uncharacterized protein n=1 Tax=Mya arenaria TaxID=6604 RepID=A0ABY7FKJ3_MYAAR|nr:hypothetical protein MAR_036384 [Mya arenaria]